jgi:hypothetical protein
MADDELREALLTGEAWDDFCETLKQAGQLILAPSVPRTDVDRAEGYRYLTRLLRMGLDQMLEHGNPDYPHLQKAAGPTRKIGIDNPDNDYFIARISGEHRYRLHGTRGTVGYIGVGIYAGSLAGGERRTIAHLNAGDLLPDADGNVNLVLSPDEPAGHEGHWIEIDPDTSTIMIRQTFLDRTTEKPARLRLERLDAEGPPPPLAADYITSSLTTVSRFVFGVAAFFAQMAEQWKVQPNRFWPSDSKVWRDLRRPRPLLHGWLLEARRRRSDGHRIHAAGVRLLGLRPVQLLDGVARLPLPAHRDQRPPCAQARRRLGEDRRGAQRPRSPRRQLDRYRGPPGRHDVPALAAGEDYTGAGATGAEGRRAIRRAVILRDTRRSGSSPGHLRHDGIATVAVSILQDLAYDGTTWRAKSCRHPEIG